MTFENIDVSPPVAQEASFVCINVIGESGLPGERYRAEGTANLLGKRILMRMVRRSALQRSRTRLSNRKSYENIKKK